MPDFDKINIDAVPYNVKDTTARQQIATETKAREQADNAFDEKISKLPYGPQYTGGRLYNTFNNPANYESAYTYVDAFDGDDTTAKPCSTSAYKTLDAALQATLSVFSNALIVLKTSATYTTSITGFSNCSFHIEALENVNATVQFTGNSLFFYQSHLAFNGPSGGSLTVDFLNIDNVRFETSSCVHNNATIKARYFQVIGGFFSATNCTIQSCFVNNGATVSVSSSTIKPFAVRSRIAVVENLAGRATFDRCVFDPSGIVSLGQTNVLYAYCAAYNVIGCSVPEKLDNVRPYYLSTSELRTTDTAKLASFGELQAIATNTSSVVTTNTP